MVCARCNRRSVRETPTLPLVPSLEILSTQVLFGDRLGR